MSFERVICLTEETVETLYLLGQEHRIVGVTGYAVRPSRVRREKPRVGAFTSADVPKILGLSPDLVLTFSDLQADIAADLIRAGVQVHAFNQRDVAGILRMIATLGRLLDCSPQADALTQSLRQRIGAARAQAPVTPPRLYFEEWDDPPITGIGWVSDLIAIAGAQDCFAHLRHHQGARDRIIGYQDVLAAQPDIIVASWCGKKVRPEKIAARPGWADLPAVKSGAIYEIKSPLILQPGPAALTEGLDALCRIVARHAPGGPA